MAQEHVMDVQPPLPASFDLGEVLSQLQAEADEWQIQQRTRQIISAALNRAVAHASFHVPRGAGHAQLALGAAQAEEGGDPQEVLAGRARGRGHARMWLTV